MKLVSSASLCRLIIRLQSGHNAVTSAREMLTPISIFKRLRFKGILECLFLNADVI